MTNEKPNYLMASVILTLLSLSITPSFGAINSEKVVGAAVMIAISPNTRDGRQPLILKPITRCTALQRPGILPEN